MSYNVIKIRFSAGNQKWKQNDKIIILMMESNEYMNK